jgi:histidinol dehydrogenase
MTVLPAKIAGVRKIVLVSPPDKNGFINPHILVVADLLKVDEIYRVGGAQAVGALAYGTKTIPKVDKIVGPGNMYVSEAKRQVFGAVDIDMIAGPTELVIIANRFSNPKFILADLKAQAEHANGLAILVTNSKALAKYVKAQLPDNNGYIVLTRNLEQAAEVNNHIAPEHLEILVNNPQRILKLIKNAGLFSSALQPDRGRGLCLRAEPCIADQRHRQVLFGLSVTDFIKSTI